MFKKKQTNNYPLGSRVTGLSADTHFQCTSSNNFETELPSFRTVRTKCAVSQREAHKERDKERDKEGEMCVRQSYRLNREGGQQKLIMHSGEKTETARQL